MLTVGYQDSLKESKLEAAKEKEANKKLEEELLMFKKQVVQQHEKGFFKAIKQVEFFTEGLDLGPFYPFKDVKVLSINLVMFTFHFVELLTQGNRDSLEQRVKLTSVRLIY